MGTTRLEAFSDGVLAIIITIMVLELKVPHPTDATPHAAAAATSFAALRPVIPIILSYLLSFIYVGIYWNNHHHLLVAAPLISGGIMWANLHLLFWLSLVPFVTAWMGENHFAQVPTALYGCVLLMSAVAFSILERLILNRAGEHSALQRALKNNFKEIASPLCYAIAIALSFIAVWAADCIYVGVALMWLMPDRRIETVVEKEEAKAERRSRR